MKKQSAYQSRIQERDEARKEVDSLKRLIHDHIQGKKHVYTKLYEISLEVSMSDETEKATWFGGTDSISENGSCAGLFPKMTQDPGVTVEKIKEACKDIPEAKDELVTYMNESDFLDLPLDAFKKALEINVKLWNIVKPGKVIQINKSQYDYMDLHPMNGILFTNKEPKQ